MERAGEDEKVEVWRGNSGFREGGHFHDDAFEDTPSHTRFPFSGCLVSF